MGFDHCEAFRERLWLAEPRSLDRETLGRRNTRAILKDRRYVAIAAVRIDSELRHPILAREYREVMSRASDISGFPQALFWTTSISSAAPGVDLAKSAHTGRESSSHFSRSLSSSTVIPRFLISSTPAADWSSKAFRSAAADSFAVWTSKVWSSPGSPSK